MDLLAGYGSDASDNSDDTSAGPAPPSASSGPTTAPTSAPSPSVSRARPAMQDDAFGAAFGATLGARHPKPVAGSAVSGALSGKLALGGLPAPGSSIGGGKRMLSFMAPLRPLSKEELEAEQLKKKPKLNPVGFSKSGFLSSLPPPKNSSAADTFGSARTMGGGGLLGSGTLGRAGLDFGDSGGAFVSQSSAASQPPSSAPAPQPAAGFSNDAYRVDATAGDGDAGYDYGPSAAPPDSGDAGPRYTEIGGQTYLPKSAASNYSSGEQYSGPALTKALPRQDGEEMLRAAMAAERSTAARHTEDPFADLGVSFKEVDQKKLTYMDPTQKEAQAGVRGALGKAYEQQLRAEADAVAPDKLSKRKHQINSLYYAAKMKELELLERRGTSLKTKAETQAKYGW